MKLRFETFAQEQRFRCIARQKTVKFNDDVTDCSFGHHVTRREVQQQTIMKKPESLGIDKVTKQKLLAFIQF